jgi:predicted transcriptional regulator
MKMLSLKLDDDIFLDTEKITKKMKCSRNRYINDALKLYNKFNERNLLRQQLADESKLARNTSIEILQEFEDLINEIDEKI